MARLNVWVPDDLAARARARGLNISALTQAALQQELSRHATDHWLDQLPALRSEAAQSTARVSHASALAALDDARNEFARVESAAASQPEEGGEPR